MNPQQSFRGRTWSFYATLFGPAILVGVLSYVAGIPLPTMIITLAVLLAGTYFHYAVRYHYVIVESTELIIRNEFLPWVLQKFRLPEINEIRVFSRVDAQVVLRIDNKRFVCNGWSQETWSKFQEVLGDKEVSIIVSH